MISGKFGLSKTRQYAILSGIKQRCYNTRNRHYGSYGAKGITVCDEWLGEAGAWNFYKWSITHGYNDNLTIDRIDSNEGYSPENCVWMEPEINSMRSEPGIKLLTVIRKCPTYEDEFLKRQIAKVSDPELRGILKARYKEVRG